MPRSLLPFVLSLALVAAPALTAQAPPTVAQVSASLHVLVRLSDGSVMALGENRAGQAGRPPAINRFLPAARVDLPAKAVQVVADEDTSYALLDDGTVWAWGRGYERQLGVALTGPAGTDRHIPAAVPGLRDVVEISARGNVALAVLADGTVRAWGVLPQALRGKTPEFPGVAPPVPVAGLDQIVHIVGGVQGFATTRDGRVFGWGANHRGGLGLGRVSNDILPPTEIPALKDVVSIAAGAAANAAVTRDGRVLTWGHNEQANLGDGGHVDPGDPAQPTPAPVKGITDAVEVKAGSYGRHMMVRRRNGTLIGWGNSDWGQLGAGISGDFQPTPTPVKLPGVEAFWLGGNFSFARTNDGALWFWGEESAARRLVAAAGNQRVPARVPPEKYLPAPPQ
jgi:alpha-tubulin suppressor-like RCC1 family protein